MSEKNICIFILSNHRSGTSATGGCLNICGIDYGKSKHSFKSEGTHSANLKVFDIDEIGCNAGSSNPFQGNISEYVIFSDVLSDSDRALVQADIMTRNSIS